MKLLFATLNLNHPYQLHQVGIALGLNPVCRILKSPSIGFNIQNHLLIPHCSYISQVVKRSTEWKPLAKSKVNAFLTAKMMQLLNQKPIYSNQLASFFIPYLSWQQQQQQQQHTHTHTHKPGHLCTPSLYMHPPVEAAILRSLSESLSQSSLFEAQTSAVAAILCLHIWVRAFSILTSMCVVQTWTSILKLIL